MQLNLLIVCVVLSQAIVGSLSGENLRQSSELLVRNKRVLNFEEGADVPVEFAQFAFIVNILLSNRIHCVGNIISSFTVITSASCASGPLSAYKIMHGSIFKCSGNSRYLVDKKIRHGNYVGARSSDGIALFTVNSPFTSRCARIINLHVGPMLAGIPATVAGWGCYYAPGEHGTQHPKKLRSITVPIMPHRECVEANRGVYNITDSDVCIYDEKKHCGHTDAGAPLIIDGELAGIYLRRRQRAPRYPGHIRDPEIFTVLQDSHYRQWISDNIVHGIRH